MDIDFFASVPQSDPGSEGGIGFDYQWHVTCYLCIEMILNTNIQRVICEYGEDITLQKMDSEIEKIQVKKRDSGNWHLADLISPPKKQKKGIFAKLFEPLQEGKKISGLKILGYGRIGGSQDNTLSLAQLIAILSVPECDRDKNWEDAMLPYCDFLSEELLAQGISKETVWAALKTTAINFSMPNSESIALKNKELLAKAAKRVWEIDITHEQAEQIYTAIYSLSKTANTAAQKTWLEKSIARQDIVNLVLEKLEYPYPTSNQSHSLTLQDKLSNASIGSKHKYALNARTTAIGLRFEKNISETNWEKLGVDIHLQWQAYQKANPKITGLPLWIALITMLESTGKKWVLEYSDPRLDSHFAEGVFFDMAGICTVDFKGDLHE